MAKWSVQVFEPTDRVVPSLEFVREFVDARKTILPRKAGKVVRFVAPKDAPLSQIAELKRLGAQENF